LFEHAKHTHKPAHMEIHSEAPKTCKRQRILRSFGDAFTIYLIGDSPKTTIEAFSAPNADHWKEAIYNEMDFILSNGTYELVDRLYHCKLVGCK
jgi:hypothetical protein